MNAGTMWIGRRRFFRSLGPSRFSKSAITRAIRWETNVRGSKKMFNSYLSPRNVYPTSHPRCSTCQFIPLTRQICSRGPEALVNYHVCLVLCGYVLLMSGLYSLLSFALKRIKLRSHKVYKLYPISHFAVDRFVKCSTFFLLSFFIHLTLLDHVGDRG
jgi:hypothetical protein